jgi:lipid-A-disaccharide synthase
MTLLVSAGEGSGDVMAAPVLTHLGVPAFGLGGPALRSRGAELVTELSQIAVMGFGAVALKAPAIVAAARRLLKEAKRRRPSAALLVGYSEFHAWLGPRLRELGIPVLWYGPPQVWAWRPERASRLSKACDRMAVILPFEEQLWRDHGADAHFVGHPSLEAPVGERDAARERLGLTPYAEYVAVLPGSRSHEVRHHLRPMLEAIAILRAERGALDARVVVAPALEAGLAEHMSRAAVEAGLSVIESTAPPVLAAFDVALAASGSVTLECAVAGVPPVIAYRTGAVSELIARRLLRVENVGLPNLVLGRREFPELVQDALSAESLAEEAGRLLDERPRYVEQCRRVQVALVGGTLSASARVAELLSKWLP